MIAKRRSWPVDIIDVGSLTLMIVLAGILFIKSSLASPLSIPEQNARNTPAAQYKPTKVATSTAAVSPELMRPPDLVKHLCSNRGGQEFLTLDGQRHTFYESAESIRRCEGGKIWQVAENGAKVNDAATFYFDESGVLRDVCQALFWRSGCERFNDIACEQTNYCESK